MSDSEIYERIRGSLMRFATSLVGSDDAADVVADAVLSTLRKRSLSSLEQPGPYLMKAVLNNARSRGRRLARERRALQRHHSMETVGHVPTHVPTSEPSEITEIVIRLPLRQRAAVYLVYWEDLEPHRAAQILGVRPATLRRYLHLAREKVRRHLDGSDG